MRKRLSPIGKTLALVVDQPILDQLAIDEHTELDLSLEGGRLILTPVRADTHQARVAAATRRALATHRVLLQRLAQ